MACHRSLSLVDSTCDEQTVVDKGKNLPVNIFSDIIVPLKFYKTCICLYKNGANLKIRFFVLKELLNHLSPHCQSKSYMEKFRLHIICIEIIKIGNITFKHF